MEIYVKKQFGVLCPADAGNEELLEALKPGEYKAVITKPRNIKFHRKFFALLNFAFEQWDPDSLYYKNQPVQKNLDRFRKDITILAGYGNPVINLKEDVRIEAKSISFASMDEVEFDELYNQVINVILDKILTNYTRDDLDDVLARLMLFT